MYDLMLDVIQTIIDGGLATAKDVDIFKDYTPDSPMACITIREYNGTPGPWYIEMGVRSIQVEVRDLLSQVALQKIWDIYELLRPETPTSELQSQACLIAMRNIPVKIGRDENHRYQYAFNMGITTKIN